MTQIDPPTPASIAKTPLGILVKLSIMMFLQYAAWGIWLQFISGYLTAPVAEGGLGFTGGQVGWILGLAASVGAVAAPFIAGQVADRWLNAEVALAILLFVGGIIKYINSYTTTFPQFLTLAVLYSVLYMPTLSLSNSIAFHHLADREKQFPYVRVWGTIGWIIASILFTSLWLNDESKAVNTSRIVDGFRVSAIIAIVYAAFALFMLPRTPPKKDIAHPFAFASAFGLLRDRGFLLVTLISLPIAMIHQTYFMRFAPFLTDAVGLPQSKMGLVTSIGQVSEIGFLVLLGVLLKKIGYRGVLVLGCTAYAARFAIFGLEPTQAVVMTAQILHGMCYGCFFAGGFIYVERVAPTHIRHSAQTVFGIIILGIGPVVAGAYNQIFDRMKDANGEQLYSVFWMSNAAIAAICGLILLATFPRGKPKVFKDA